MRRPANVFFCAVLLFAACGPLENLRPDGGDAPDAGDLPDSGAVTDAGQATDAGLELDAGVRDVDWRQARGGPWSTRVVGEYAGARPFAMTDGGFVLVTACDAGACDYEFRDPDGNLKQRRTNLRPLFGTTVSPTGAFASLFDATPEECTRTDGSRSTFWSGAWHLLDLDTGDSRASLAPFLTAEFTNPAFLRLGLHARLVPTTRNECTSVAPILHAMTAPSPMNDRLTSLSWPDDELADGSVAVTDQRNGNDVLVLLDPRGATNDLLLNDDVAGFLAAGDVLHGITRQPARAFTSFDSGSRRLVRTELRWTEHDYLERGVSDRYVVFCNAARPTPRCEVHDGLGERAPVVITAQVGMGTFPMAVAGKAHFVVYAHDGKLWRRSLLTGEEALVHPRIALARTVGGGRAVTIRDGDTLVAVEADRVFTFPGALRGLVDAVALGASHDAPQAGTLLVVTASASGGENWLHAWNTRTGRIARLTDSLFFNEPFQAPLTAADLCNAPGFVRSAGSPFESAFVNSKLVHFTEFVPQAQPLMRLFVMPVDLSAPPRLIAEGPSGFCGTPLATPNGERLWLPVPMPTGGVRGVMAVP